MEIAGKVIIITGKMKKDLLNKFLLFFLTTSSTTISPQKEDPLKFIRKYQ